MASSPETLDYAPKTLISSGNKLYSGDQYYSINEKHAVIETKIDGKPRILVHNYTGVHHVAILDEKFNKIGEETYDSHPDFNGYYVAIIDKKQFIGFARIYSIYYQDGDSCRSFDTSYFRLDDERNLLILLEGPDKKHIKVRLFQKSDNYQTSIDKIIKCPEGRYYGCNALFFLELKKDILSYYGDGYILCVKYHEKINVYDVAVRYPGGGVHVDRWTYQEKWVKKSLFITSIPGNFYQINALFNKRTIVCFSNSSFNFASLVAETYLEWRERILKILSEFVCLRGFSLDLLGLLLDYIYFID